MQTRLCNNCGSNRLKFMQSVAGFKYSPDHHYNLVGCENCGLVYTDVEIDECFIVRNYPQNYKPHDPKSETNSTLRRLFMSALRKYVFGKKPEAGFLIFGYVWQILFTLYNKTAYRSIPLFRDAGKLLDVGCGKGDYLRLLQDLGWSVRGVEPVSSAAELSKNAGFVVECKKFENVDSSDQFFDVITMWHVLEHFPAPGSILQKVSKMLKDDGLLLIGVPNYDSLDRKIFQSFWNGFEIPLHLFHFTPNSIKNLLTNSGFECGKIVHTVRPSDLVSSLENIFVSKLKRNPRYLKTVFFLIMLPISVLFSMIRRSSVIVIQARKKH